MAYTFDRQQLHVEIHTRGCNLAEEQRTRMQDSLRPVESATAEFPTAKLHVNVIFHPNSKLFHAESKLKLPGSTLFSGEHDAHLEVAFQRSLDRLVERLGQYRQDPQDGAVRQAQQRSAQDADVVMPEDPEAGPIAEAVHAGDYRAFRTALARYEDWLRLRIGRWIQRVPEAQSRVLGEPVIGDLVESVYLNAFEQFTHRNTGIRLSEWLDRLVDPAVQEYLRHPDDVHEEASLARTMRGMPQG